MTPSDSYTVSAAVSSLHLDDALVLNESGVSVPQTLKKIEVGAGFSRNLSETRNVGVRFAIGSASDKPFANGRDTTYNLNTFYSFPTSETKRWALFLFMSNNTPIFNNIPIPGFMYFYRTDKFTGIFGLPFLSLQWSPINPWSYSLSFFGPVFNTEITYGHTDKLQSLVGLSWNPQSFMRDARKEDTDRLFLDEKRVFVGVRSAFHPMIAGELLVGSAFNRSLYEGPSVGKKTHGSLDLDNTTFINWNFRLSF